METTVIGEASEPARQRAIKFVASNDCLHPRPTSVRTLRSWNAEGWYVEACNTISAFTTENKLAPPAEAVALFNQIIYEPAKPFHQTDLKDVCLGFCYDPIAGLGYLHSNNRCHGLDNDVHCN